MTATTTTRIEDVVKQEMADATAEFVRACWQGTEAARLLPLARAAGISTRQADAARAQISAARRASAAAGKIASLRAAAAKATAAAEKVTADAERKIDEIREAASVAQRSAQQAQQQLADAENDISLAVEQAQRWNIPEDLLPPEVLAIFENERSQTGRMDVHKGWVAAREKAKRAQNELADCRHRIKTCMIEVGDRDAAIAFYENRLTQAQQQLDKAAAAAKAAGFEIN